jgi:hypothetical protein
MTLYCRIDLHAINSVLAVQDEDDQISFEKRLPNDLATILSVLEPYRAELSGCVVESTYNWYWLVDGLMDAGFAVHLAHTGAIPQYADSSTPMTRAMPGIWRTSYGSAAFPRAISIPRLNARSAIFYVDACNWCARRRSIT